MAHTPDYSLRNGTLLDKRYQILRYISSGGFGITYEAIDTRLKSKVAIKELYIKTINYRDGNSQSIQTTPANISTFNSTKKKFIKEARRLCSFSHSHIVRVTDVFEENGTAYYTMDFIEGKSLSQIPTPLPEERVTKYLDHILSALEHVHKKGILHLDLKPGNIMIDNDDNAMLIDFGASKVISDSGNDENSSSTTGGAYTPGYAPIEQIIPGSSSSLGTFSDMYALGATLYTLFAGKKPPMPNDILSFGLPPVDGISDNMNKAIAMALTYDKRKRIANVDQFRRVLKGEIIDIEADALAHRKATEEEARRRKQEEEEANQQIARRNEEARQEALEMLRKLNRQKEEAEKARNEQLRQQEDLRRKQREEFRRKEEERQRQLEHQRRLDDDRKREQWLRQQQLANDPSATKPITPKPGTPARDPRKFEYKEPALKKKDKPAKKTKEHNTLMIIGICIAVVAVIVGILMWSSDSATQTDTPEPQNTDTIINDTPQVTDSVPADTTVAAPGSEVSTPQSQPQQTTTPVYNTNAGNTKKQTTTKPTTNNKQQNSSKTGTGANKVSYGNSANTTDKVTKSTNSKSSGIESNPFGGSGSSKKSSNSGIGSNPFSKNKRGAP